MSTVTDSPCVYVADLGAYNSGFLHGVWVSMSDDLETINEQIQKMLSESPIGFSEETAIHDFENWFGLHVNDYDSLSSLHDLAVLIEKHGEAYAKYTDNMGLEHATEEGFEEAYQGQWDSELAFTENLIDECGLLAEVPEVLQCYFDTESYARDLFISDYYSLEGSEGVHVFVNL